MQHRKEPRIDQRFDALAPAQFEQRHAFLPLARNHRMHAGIEQREALDAFGCKAKDLQRNAPAHRMAGERDSARRRRQHTLRHLRETARIAVAADGNRGVCRQCGNLRGPNALIAHQAG